MRSLRCIMLSLLLVLVQTCKSSESQITQAQKDNLKAVVNNKAFRIESNWAYPQVTGAVQQVMNSGLMQPGSSANAISLIGNANFLEVKKDSISSYLPYFGERQMQVGYGASDSAIQFMGLTEDYKVVPNKHEGYDISFKATSKSEKFQVNITLFPNLNANIAISGGSRFGIRYAGKVASP